MVKVPKTRKEAIEMLRQDRIANPRPLSPCARQTEDDIAAYYRGADIGAAAVVRQTHGGLLLYHVTAIDGSKPERGRVYIRNHGAFYSKHGKNCFHPTGQTTLVVPTEEVLAWADAHPRGEFGVSIHSDPWPLSRSAREP